ncbi:YHS domain-containing (seleno)protein [Hyunsoonleella pacifica]|uniref:YHS domain-containing protein n=1 Tax=Hyunsoonleella pacifica TaxID=1080224 RepID=A0A4Q9FPH8_9FLAO|nr:YHS domain-containing (seleno)protein [Hyunsoonleella pacifica]TBN15693.1 hypothetical protein EYD46_11255 [Hyunsoonleella pacifica]GGD21866.1 hypothetical protein GCM10011368_24890 [Hyunsoonleella pacifica]
MKLFSIFFITLSTTVFSQTIDYNTKKGFAANGYDVVAYFTNEPKEGIKKFKTIFNNINYKFSSEENLKLFLEHPEKYIPQYGGYCAYAVALKSDKVSINPKSFLIKDEKLYLFYNAWGTNTLELWLKDNHNKLTEMADNNWDKIKFNK